MKNIIRRSFKRELLAGFMLVALVPLVLSAGLLVRILENRINAEYTARINRALDNSCSELETFIGDIDRISVSIALDSDIRTGIPEADSWLKNKAYTRLYERTGALRNRASFEVYDAEGECRFTTSPMSRYESLPPYWGILKTSKTHPDELIVRRASQYLSDRTVCLQTARAVINSKDECIGYVVAGVNEDSIRTLLKGSASEIGCMALMDAYWENIFCTVDAAEIGFQEQLRAAHTEGNSSFVLKDGTMAYVSGVGDSGLVLAMGLEPVLTRDITAAMYPVMAAIALASFVLCIIAAVLMSAYLSRPVAVLSASMRRVEEGELDVRINSSRSDELGRLSRGFDLMTERLKDNMEREIRQQAEINESNIAMMQAQLNPHFLYNTLDTIKWGAKQHDAPELATLAASLAGILRTGISGDRFIRLSEELKLVERYVGIQNIRFGGNIRYDVECPGELEELMVPKLILQPIVENSIIHGLSENKEGFVFVNVYLTDGVLCIDVEDSGKGMDPDILAKLSERDREALKGHLGFYNVDTIIRLYYGEDFGLSAGNLNEGGCRVRIRLPAEGEKYVEGNNR